MTMHALTGCQVVSNCLSACSSMMCPGHGLFSLLDPADRHSICAATVDATNDTTWMKQRLLWAMDKLDLSQASREAWLAHLHFSTLPMTGLSDIRRQLHPLAHGQVARDQEGPRHERAR